MSFPPSLRAREPRAAARTAVLVLGVCAGMLALVALLGPAGSGDASSGVVWGSVLGLLAAATVFARVPPERLDAVGAFLLLAVGGVLVLCTLAIASGSSATRVQAILAFAVLYAGFHIRAAGALTVTAVAVLGGVVVILHGSPVAAAFSDLVFFGTMLAGIGGLLVRSVEAQDRLVAALRRQADVDGLTGLVTRRVLDQAVVAALSTARPEAGIALAVMDVDDFKTINDRHGHPVGDDALVHLAEVLLRRVRTGDAVVGRLGGDEVAVLLSGCAPDVAARRAEEMLEAVRSTPLLLPDGTLLAISVSIGVAHAPRHAADLRALYSAADAALYAAKRAGRGRVELAGA